MVRCGHCRQTFDARPAYVSDQPSPQLELPMLDIPVAEHSPNLPVLEPMTLAEQVAIIKDADDNQYQSKRLTWPWVLAVMTGLTLFLLQAAYIFRVDMAARMPVFKPVLVQYCHLLDCEVPLPQHAELMGIESSELTAVPGHGGWIILTALLRNRAPYAQAFPNLQLTLNDSQDNPLARRTFRPEDYLPATESLADGLLPSRELGIRLQLDTSDLKPMGYRLVLFYPSY